jgi:aminoglycoside phosphotransferase (APT) family kinase protein
VTERGVADVTRSVDGAVDLAALRRYLVGVDVPVAGELRVEPISGGRSNLTYLLYDDTSTWVLRRPPLHGATPSAHDMSREHRVVSALAMTGVPVARAVALCEDVTVLGVPFTIAEYVVGRVIRNADELDLIVSDDDVRDCAFGLVEVLADLHAIEPSSVGLGDWGRSDGYLNRQLTRWASQWAIVRHVDDPRDTDVGRLCERLSDSVPMESAAAIVHGDFRVDNTILDSAAPYSVKAVVDWEMSTIGDPLSDVALMCVYRNPALNSILGVTAAWTSPRLPSSDELAHRYSLASGSALDNWDFHMALGYLKLAVIAAGIDYRRRSDNGLSDPAGDAVAPLIAEGLRRLSDR